MISTPSFDSAANKTNMNANQGPGGDSARCYGNGYRLGAEGGAPPRGASWPLPNSPIEVVQVISAAIMLKLPTFPVCETMIRIPFR